MTAVANTAFTAAQFNTHVRDNLNETAPAKASAEGQYFVSTGANAIAARLPSQDGIDTIQTTTSTSFTDLATIGPDVTVSHGTRTLIGIYSYLANNTNSQGTICSWEWSGSHTLGSSDSRAIYCAAATAPVAIVTGATFLTTAMTAGSSTGRLKYRVTGGTGTFDHRRIWAQPY